MSEDKALEPEVVEPKSSFDRGLKTQKRTFTGIAGPVEAKIVELLVKDVPQQDIAKITNVSQGTVSRVLKKFEGVFKALPKVLDYRNVRSDLLAAAQLSALETAVSPSKLAKTSSLGAAKVFEVFYKAERLEVGMSTDNHAHMHVGALPNGTES